MEEGCEGVGDFGAEEVGFEWGGGGCGGEGGGSVGVGLGEGVCGGVCCGGHCRVLGASDRL